MILDKEVEIVVGSNTINYYKNIGYINIKCGQKLVVKIEDLYKGSIIKINVKCDICDCKKQLPYKKYIMNISRGNDLIYCCSRKCGDIKTKQTKLKKYGDENYNNKKQIKETRLEKYGVPLTSNRKTYRRKHYETNKEKEKIQNEKWKEENKDKIGERVKKYQNKNKDRINEYNRKYTKNRKLKDPLFKLTGNIRTLIYKSFKNNYYTKRSKTHELIGCSFEFLRTHIESLWEPWMSWSNYGSVNGKPPTGKYQCWDIDHIIPLTFAKTEEELLKLFHYINCQPLCSYINRNIKRNKINFK